MTSDPSRNKCIEMFYGALKCGVDELKGQSNAADSFHEPYELDNACRLSTDIEHALFAEYRSVSAGYRALFRTKYLNLKEKTNPELRRQILTGDITPKRFIEMTLAEMASEERKKADHKINQDNLNRARAARDNAPETDMFQCGRCKQRKCKYFQMQTRSADEPMTAYITCMNCGNRWKM